MRLRDLGELIADGRAVTPPTGLSRLADLDDDDEAVIDALEGAPAAAPSSPEQPR